MSPVANMPVLEVKNLKKHFMVRKGLLRPTVGQVYAVDGINFSIGVFNTLSLMLDTGFIKTTSDRAVLRLIEPTSGSVQVGGTEITGLSKSEMRPYRAQMQIIFQDPFSSLNLRMTADEIVAEPLLVHGTGPRKGRNEQVAAPVLPRRPQARAEEQLPAPISWGAKRPQNRHPPRRGH